MNKLLNTSQGQLAISGRNRGQDLQRGLASLGQAARGVLRSLPAQAGVLGLGALRLGARGVYRLFVPAW